MNRRNKSILIIGASGQVGSALRYQLVTSFNVTGTYSKTKREGLFKLDIRNEHEVKLLLEKLKPLCVVVTAALTNVDYCETHREEAYAINVEGTRNVALMCEKIGAKLVYYSTDYIFDGKNGPYSEEDEPNPINYYGKTKLLGEKIVGELEDHLIIRTTNVFDYGYDSRNFFVRIFTSLKNRNQVTVPNDQYANPTLATELAFITKKLIEAGKSGIYNVVGRDYLTRYEFAVKLAEYFGFDVGLVKGMTTSQLNQAAKRPLKAGLKTDKIQKELKVKPLSLAESFAIISKKMKKEGENVWRARA